MRRRAVSYLGGQHIRCIWVKEKDSWFYSVVDFIKALSVSSDPGRYWADFKRRKKIPDELLASCEEFKLEGKDGKKRPSDMVTVEILEKICMTILPVSEFKKMHAWLGNFRLSKNDPNFGFVVHKKLE